MKIDFLKTPVAVVGAGKSGSAALEVLKLSGLSDKSCTLFDDKEGKGTYSDAQKLLNEFNPQTIILSPGYPLATPWLQDFKARGGVILGETEFASKFLSTEKLIGVTGSLAKSTTVALLGEGLKSFSKSSFVGGNFGIPLSQYVADVIAKKRERADWVVLELSSFQLETCETVRFATSAITYFAPNHLERYKDLAEYYATKWKLLGLTQGAFLLNEAGGDLAAYSKLRGFAPANPAALVSRERFTKLHPTFDLSKSKLIGLHNQDNLALAAEIGFQCGWPMERAFSAMCEFRGLSHRLENCGDHGNITWINDSKATSIPSVLTAARAALESFPKRRVVLLLGGRDKKLPWEELGTALKDTEYLHPIFFGESGALVEAKTALRGPRFATLTDTMTKGRAFLRPNDVVLLSPGGTSLDEFKNFEERGSYFSHAARESI